MVLSRPDNVRLLLGEDEQLGRSLFQRYIVGILYDMQVLVHVSQQLPTQPGFLPGLCRDLPHCAELVVMLCWQGMQHYRRQQESHVEYETNGWLIGKQLEVCALSAASLVESTGT